MLAVWRDYYILTKPRVVQLLVFTAVVGNLDGMVQIVQNSWHRVVDGTAFPAFDFWRSSRMLPNLENIDPNPLAFWVPEKPHY